MMLRSRKKIAENESGAVMLLALVLSAILISMITTLVAYWMTQQSHHRQAVTRTEALALAEAGAEMAIWKLNNQPGYVGETGTAFAGGTFNITITNLSSTTKLIKADAFIPNATSPRSKRSVQVTATIGTTNIGFNYGVQVGNGGLDMTNTATIVGNVYANGDIVGSNSARIEGTAIVADTGIIDGMDITGNAQAHTIRGSSNIDGNVTASVFQNSTVDGNLVADTISSCTVGGAATYDTRTSCTVSGTATTPNPNDYPQAPSIPLPITEEQIDLWEQEAEAGGTITTVNLSSGSMSLGPKKINGDLILSNTAQLTVTGTLWVTGQILITNQAIMSLHSGYGSLSGVVMAGIDESTTAGYIELLNNTQVLGSGTAGSYLMLLSQKEGVASNAIRNNNAGTSAILYAGEGMIEIGNSGGMQEITAQKLRISNSATITYETGLANANFSSGPGGGWEILDQTWQLLQ